MVSVNTMRSRRRRRDQNRRRREDMMLSSTVQHNNQLVLFCQEPRRKRKVHLDIMDLKPLHLNFGFLDKEKDPPDQSSEKKDYSIDIERTLQFQSLRKTSTQNNLTCQEGSTDPLSRPQERHLVTRRCHTSTASTSQDEKPACETTATQNCTLEHCGVTISH